MTRRVINPWNWQEDQGWAWGIEVTGPARILHTSAQVPYDTDGRLLYPDDVRGQAAAALDNLETVLAEAEHVLADLVRIDYYTTRPDELLANWDVISSRLLPAGCRAGGVLLGVDRLPAPGLLVQVQAVSICATPFSATSLIAASERAEPVHPTRSRGRSPVTGGSGRRRPPRGRPAVTVGCIGRGGVPRSYAATDLTQARATVRRHRARAATRGDGAGGPPRT